MVGPHHRAGSNGRLSEENILVNDLENETKRKKGSEKSNSCYQHVYDYSRNALDLIFPSASSKMSNDGHYFGSNSKSRYNFINGLLKLVLLASAFVALFGSVRWMLSISRTSQDNFLDQYWWVQLQEKLITDFSDIQELSLGSSRLKEIEFCSPEYENHVPCFNSSETTQLERKCGKESRLSCVIRPPKNYRSPLGWPAGKDVIWYANVKISAQEVLSSGTLTKRLMMLDEEQISFRSDSVMVDGVEDYAHQIADMIGLRSVSDFNKAGISTVLDIGCGYGSFGAHLFSRNMLTMCIANYESSGSQIQITLERGLPAMIASFTLKRLPFSSLSFDMLHCARCDIEWDQKDGVFLVEADRLLKPGGYFVWTSPIASVRRSVDDKDNQKKWQFVQQFAESLCWNMLAQQEDTVIWRKTTERHCYASRKQSSRPSVCKKSDDVGSSYNQPLRLCIDGTHSPRWVPIGQRRTWPSRAALNTTELSIHGVSTDVFSADILKWKAAVKEYWSLLSPQIFSDHPKRPGDDDPSPPFNMLRNVLDMNSQFGGFNYALLETGKNVWVMNVVPTTAPNSLPLIQDRGFIGTSHDWCEAFLTYPRTYDMIHADGLLSLETHLHQKCRMLDLFIEMDRLLRAEGWVIFRDTPSTIDLARLLATRLRWDARIIEIEANSDVKILICQKPFSEDKPKHMI
ncbi:hypothetical protein RND81_06G029700 [Saponaria officinalis]|uniref:Methyltransferase n=1 Tax=Saponaria officinalis TaxID=3572 RepID=A0AAW1K727_SAPOF